MLLSPDEEKLVMHLMQYAQREGLPAKRHPAWNTLARKLQHLENAPQVVEESDLQRLVLQGYTEKEAHQILERLKNE